MAVARFEGLGGTNPTGLIDVFERPGPGEDWAVVATIAQPEGYFFLFRSNMQVALDGDRIVIRASLKNGAGYFDDPDKLLVYDRNPVSGAWVQAAQLDPGMPVLGDIEVDGDRITFRGWEFYCHGGADCERDHEVLVEGWQRNPVTGEWERTFNLSTVRSQFPFADLDGDRLVVRHRTGTIRIFDADPDGTGWFEAAVLTGDPGFTVAVDGDRVAAIADDRVSVYERASDGTWGLAATIAQPAEGWGSPCCIRLSGNTLAFSSGGNTGPIIFLYERDPGTDVWTRANVPEAPADDRVLGIGLDRGTVAASFGPATFGGGVNPQTIAVFERQVDTDGDGIPDADDPDDDGDGVADGDDAFPTDPSESVDTDGDGIGNNADTDDDGDGLPDGQDPAPLDPDADDDGIVDGRDVEHIQAAIAQLPAAALHAPGHRHAMTVQLDQVEAFVALGNEAAAIQKLQDLRRHLDGCGTQADNNDWVKDCAAQTQLRAQIDALIANLQAP